MTGTSSREFSGVSVVISPDGILKRASGIADRVHGRVWTLDTQSQVASISKQFVAACALILIDRGLLALDDPVGRHLLDSGPAWDEVTVSHLLTHTSGLSHWTDEPGFVPSISMPAPERLGLLLATRPSGRRVGDFLYSSPGYIVLSAVLAAAAGRPYADLARELIIEPLALADTTLGSPGRGNAARGYRRGEPAQAWDLASMPGTGDVWSTAGDLARFIGALHTGGLLPESTQPLLHRIRVPDPSSHDSPFRVDSYALGHFVATFDGNPAHLHPGDNPGYQSLVVWLPHASTTAAVLTNDEAVDIESAAAELLRNSTRGE